MWYAVQTMAGKEEAVKHEAELLIPDADFRVLYRKGSFKYKGSWKRKNLALFPGYLFVITDDPRSIVRGLRKVSDFARIVSFDDELIPISASEQHILETLVGDGDTAENSMGFTEGDEVIVTDGPLVGLESRIARIDRHKRLAFVEFNMGSRIVEIRLELEIIDKR